MDTCGEGEVGGVVEGAFLQAGLEVLAGEFVGDIGLQGERCEIDLLVRALHGELAVLEFDVVGRCLQHMASHLLRLGLDLVERLDDGRHAHRARARAIGAHAHLHLVGVAMDDGDIIDGNAEAVGDQLREGRLVALPMGVGARENLHRADRVDANFRAFPKADAGAQRAHGRRGRDAAGLDIGGNADAAQQSLAGGFGLALVDVGVVRQLQRLVEGLRIVAAIVAHDDGRLVRELGHEVLAAELGGVAADFARGDFHQPLHHEGRLRTARAAIGVDRRGVGVDPVHFRIDGGDIVLARQQRRIEIGRHGRREGGEIGAEIGGRLHPQAQDLARLVHGELRMGDMVAAMGVAEEGLRTVAGPFDGTAHLLGGPDADGLLRINEDLRAEAAAHVRRHHAQFMLGRDANESREHQPRHMGILAGGVEREGFRPFVIFAHGRARLHGVGRKAIVDDFERRDVLGLCEGRVRRVLVAKMPFIDGVIWRNIMHDGRA